MKRAKIHGKLSNALKQVEGVLADNQHMGANPDFAFALQDVKSKLDALLKAVKP